MLGNFQRVWQDRNDNVEDETEEKITQIRNLFRDAGFAVNTNYLLHGVSNSCYGDKLNHLLINYNGDVYGCTARDFNKENRIGFLDSCGEVHYDYKKLEKWIPRDALTIIPKKRWTSSFSIFSNIPS